jgi:hypothetical protein
VSGRRRFLQGAAALLVVRETLAAGTVEKGVYRVRGEARVNGALARPGMDVNPGDAVTTAADSEIIFVVNRDAFLLRGRSRLEVGAAAGNVFRLVTGALLSVYQPGVRKTLHAQNATIGIRGTGVYVESAADKSYVCTCYGEAELIPLADPGRRDRLFKAIEQTRAPHAPVHPQGLGNLFADGKERIERHHRVLQNHGDVAASNPLHLTVGLAQ